MSARLEWATASSSSFSAYASTVNVRARWRVGSSPVFARASAARGAVGSPVCQPPVPLELTWTRSARPARDSRSSRTTCAIGERQILPRHTISIRYGPDPSDLCIAFDRSSEERVDDRDNKSAEQRPPESVDMEDDEVYDVGDPFGEQQQDRVDHQQE